MEALPDFLIELINEQQYLKNKIVNLEAFIASKEFEEIPYTTRDLLNIQLEAMNKYNEALLGRLEQIKIEI